MKIRLLSFLALTVLPLAAQEKKPAKTDVSAKDRAKINAKVKELKNKEEFKKAWDIVERAAERNKNAQQEVERMKKDGADLTTDEAKQRLESSMKGLLTPEESEALKKNLQDATSEAKAELEKQREKMRREQGKSAPNPLPQPAERPETFEKVTPPAPLPPMKAVEMPVAPLRAWKVIKGPENDPKNPDKPLPASDIRTRTWIAQGDVRVRLRDQQVAIDADEITIIWKADQGPGGLKKKGADPLDAKRDTPFERLVARGRVRIMFVDQLGRVQVGRGGYMVYDQTSGEFLVKEWPEIQIENKLVRSDTKTGSLRMSPKIKDGIFEGAILVETLASELKAEDLPVDHHTTVPDAPARVETNKLP